jgi:hypothetical protein
MSVQWGRNKSYPIRAARVALGLSLGYVETTLQAAHSCHNIKCVTPEHLRWATGEANMSDSVRSGRLSKKLTLDQVELIARSPERISVLAERFGVTGGTIYAIKRKRIWGSLGLHPVRVRYGPTLSEKEVREIFLAPGPQREIARRFNVDQSVVSRIKSGVRWGSVTGVAA